MKIGVAEFTHVRGDIDALFEHLLVNTLARGVNHAIEVHHAADFEPGEILGTNRYLQPDCFTLFLLLGHATDSLLI